MEWIACNDRLPDLNDDLLPSSDYVLATDGKGQWVAYIVGFDDEPIRWKEKGRDGYSLENITHWQPLPSLPEPA